MASFFARFWAISALPLVPGEMETKSIVSSSETLAL